MFYKKLENTFDIKRLQNETLRLFSNENILSPLFPYQIGLTYENEKTNNKFIDGVGSLDWDYEKWTEEDKINGRSPKPKERKVTEKDFNKVVPDLKGTYLYEILHFLKENYDIGRTRLMKSNPKTCLTWHRDSTYRIHIPIFTNEGCFMVWENCTLHMPEGSFYWVDTTVPHTAFNGSFKERIHLVATVEEKI